MIPVLLLHDGGLWKSERFRPKTYVGDPTNAVRIFNDKEVDELIVLDVDASREGRGPDVRTVERLASECFMPLCYGGGIRHSRDARDLFAVGVEKVSLNHALLGTSSVAGDIAALAGSQAVVGSIDLVRRDGNLLLFDHVRRATVGKDWLATLNSYVAGGVGEILLNCVDRDGTLSGPDLEAARLAGGACRVPVIACGGVRGLVDAEKLIAEGASAVAAGALFVYRGPHRAILITYPRPEQLRRAESHDQD